jgi:GldM C-terminal domain
MRYFILFLFLVQKSLFAQSAVGNDKMNILYIGLDDPLVIAADGIPADELEVDFGGACSIQKIGKGYHYTAIAMKANQNAVLKILHKGKVIGEHIFRILRIPDPEVALLIDDKNSKGGLIAVGKFRATTALTIEMENFNFDVSIDIQSFNCTRISRRKDAVTYSNQGAIFSKNLLSLIQTAEIGDTFYFDEIKARTPGDDVGRSVGSLVFIMK